MDVPEVGGEQREQRIDIETGPIPADERSDRKAMPQIVQPRAVPMAMAMNRRTQANLTGHLGKRVLSGPDRDADALLRQKQGRGDSSREDTISGSRIDGQRSIVEAWSGTSRDLPNFDRRISQLRVSVRWTSASSSASASEIRSPVTASKPNRVA